METIIAAIVAGTFTAAASIYSARAQNEKTLAVLTERIENNQRRNEDRAAEQAERTDQKIAAMADLTNQKIDNLAAHVEKHNGVVERMYQAESQIALLEQDSKTAWHAIDEMRGRVRIGGTE